MMQSSPFNYRRIIMWIGRIVLGVTFLYAGYSKLFLPNMHPHPPIKIALSLFALQVDSYQMLPPWGVNFVAHTLPFAEIILGLLLIIGWQLRIWGTLVSIVVLVLFVAVAHSYAKGLEINCGCFANPEPLTIWTVIRDGLLLALAVLTTVFAFMEARKPHPWAAQS
jgi:putative oxidoreductase